MKKLILHSLHQFKNCCDHRESPFPVICFFYKWFNKPINKISENFYSPVVTKSLSVFYIPKVTRGMSPSKTT